jgi:hypothetical protein
MGNRFWLGPGCLAEPIAAAELGTKVVLSDGRSSPGREGAAFLAHPIAILAVRSTPGAITSILMDPAATPKGTQPLGGAA